MKGWNRPSNENPATRRQAASAGSVFKWLSSCAAVALLLVAGYYFFIDDKESSGPSEVKPAKQGEVAATRGRDKGKNLTEKLPNTNEGSAASVRKVVERDVPMAFVTNAASDVQTEDVSEDASAKDKRLFKNAMDQLLAMVAPKNVGDSVPPLPIVDGMEFSEEDEKKILERLTADENDSDAVLDRKEIVQAMRDEYHELKKRGWTFIDYLKALEAKTKLDTEVLEESHKLHDTVFDDPAISDEKYFETLEKINKILADRGIEQIKPPTDENEEEK